ncbi:hypothetical protein MBLNU230_g5330t2 [Neophaeotheca triangularis]
MPPVDGQRYYTSTAVFLNEVIKLTLSLTVALYEIAVTSPSASTAIGLFQELYRAVFVTDSWRLAIPAVLYTLQNSLQYIAVSNLDAATFQVTYQMKILTTAIFSVTLLGRSLTLRKWLSLVLLMIGVAVVQIPVAQRDDTVLSLKDLTDGVAFHSPRNIWDLKALGSVAAGQLTKRSATYEGIDEDVEAQHPELNTTIGLAAVLAACILSGLAGVYFEKILKDPKGRRDSTSKEVSVWIRNVQLSFYSLWPALLVGVLVRDGEHISQTGFFTGYNWVVWGAILLQATGGIVVALVVKHADNILKNFATSVSIIISFLASVVFFDFHITWAYLLGTAIVLASTWLYNTGPVDHRQKPPPISVSEYEKRGGEPGYFDVEAVASAARSPGFRNGALSTSRPSTPTYERKVRPSKSTEFRISKREA